MPKPSTYEIHSAIAAYLMDSRNSSVPLSVLATRLNVSVSTLRRISTEFGIVRRPRLGTAVLERIDHAHGEESK